MLYAGGWLRFVIYMYRNRKNQYICTTKKHLCVILHSESLLHIEYGECLISL